MKKLAIIATHPIQYYGPWFAYLTKNLSLELKVFYLWNFGVSKREDPEFQRVIQWDISLLQGYESEFVPNVSLFPGTNHFLGLINPSLSERVKRFEPGYVFLTAYNYLSLSLFILEWASRVPLIFRGDSHRIIKKDGSFEPVRQNIISYLFKKFSAFLFVGSLNQEYFLYHRVSPAKLFFTPHAVDNSRFFGEVEQTEEKGRLWRRELGIPENHAVVLFAGKLLPKKRPFDLLKAFLSANLQNVSLLFVGSGGEEDRLKKEAIHHPHIYFAPFQNQSLMPRTYAAADLVVLPSFGSRETWGLAINEAMCMSRAVIVSSHVGCAPDLVHHYRNGLVFPAGDVEALSSALIESFADRERLRKWGQESRRMIENYSYSKMTEGLKEAIAFLDSSSFGASVCAHPGNS